jgi:RHS repeat-associated protein
MLPSCTQIGTLAYGYDPRGRTTSVSGTLAGFAPPAYVPSLTYDGANRLTNWNGTPLAYDGNGNLTTFGSTTNIWNARNQLVATSAGGASFSYDALGRRTSATVSGVTTPFVYDGWNPVVISGKFTLGSLELDDAQAIVSAGAATSLLRDGLNSTVALSDPSAVTTAIYSYSPYGDTAASGTGNSTLQYTGRENDGATGLYYYRNRYYSPQLGRFISEDPLGLAAGINYYAYVRGSPVSRRDPLGLADESPTTEIDYTGAGTKAYNACEAIDRQATALFKAAAARAKSDWKAFNEHMQEADRQLNKYMENTNGKAQDAPTAPRGPEPETPLPDGTIKPLAPPDVSLPKFNF